MIDVHEAMLQAVRSGRLYALRTQPCQVRWIDTHAAAHLIRTGQFSNVVLSQEHAEHFIRRDAETSISKWN